MKTPKDLREEAERCIRLARQTIDNSVAFALFAYACELEQRVHLIEKSEMSDTSSGHRRQRMPVPADHRGVNP